jgi:glutathione synthase/RimK-type ligase-like ATP-grasp enzyme
MTRIALATSRDLPELWAGDRLFLDELRRRGFTAAPLVWDDPAVRWEEWDAVLIRSCWDYHLKIERFMAWIEHLAVSGRIVINRPGLIAWNAHKRYLLEVERLGGRIPPTAVIARGTPGDLQSHLARHGWRDAVIKPAISASGYKTRLVRGTAGPDDEAAFREMVLEGDVLAQAYVPEVAEHGEWSFVFFDGRYSHAALKRAADGEFRVHIEWGGTVEDGTPPPALIVQAQGIIDALALGATFARVDGTEYDGDLMLMEIEVIEPELFFDRHPEATARLADAVERVLQSRT